MSNLVVTTEVAAAILASKTGSKSAKEMQADPKAYMASNFNFNFKDGTDVSVVENSATQQNLALPYYGGLEPKPEILSEEELADPSGGYSIWAATGSALWMSQQLGALEELGFEGGSAEHIADMEANPGRYNEDGTFKHNK